MRLKRNERIPELRYYAKVCTAKIPSYETDRSYQTGQIQIRARLFKPNDVISWPVVKISNVNISNMPIFFVEKI